MRIAGGRFVGNDVVDLAAVEQREWDGRDAHWAERHLTPSEKTRLGGASPHDRARVFWSFFAAKEAGSKAFAQSGIETRHNGFACLEVDLMESCVTELASGKRADLFFPQRDSEKIHALAVTSDPSAPSAELWNEVASLPAGRSPSDFARERLTAAVASAAPHTPPDAWAVGSVAGRPRLLVSGRWLDWSVSLSHSGRFVAWSCVAPRTSA